MAVDGETWVPAQDRPAENVDLRRLVAIAPKGVKRRRADTPEPEEQAAAGMEEDVPEPEAEQSGKRQKADESTYRPVGHAWELAARANVPGPHVMPAAVCFGPPGTLTRVGGLCSHSVHYTCPERQVSGKKWKAPGQKASTVMRPSAHTGKSWNKKMQERAAQKHLKDIKKEAVEAAKAKRKVRCGLRCRPGVARVSGACRRHPIQDATCQRRSVSGA